MEFSVIYIIVFFILGVLGYLIFPLVKIGLLKLKYGNKLIWFYSPFLGLLAQFKEGLVKHRDILYFDKRILIDHPQAELKIVNTSSGRLLYNFFKIEHIRFILQNQQLYRKNSQIPFGEQFLYKGLIFQEGEAWKTARGLLSPYFNFEQLKGRIPIIKQECENAISLNEDQGIDIVKIGGIVAGQVITKTFFGLNTQDTYSLSDELVNLMVEFLQLGRKYPMAMKIRGLFYSKTCQLPNWMLFKHEKALLFRLSLLKQKVQQLIFSHASDKSNNDYLTAFLNAQKINKNITDDEIIQQYFVFLFAGIDTTSNLFGSCCYALSINKEIQQKLRICIKEQIQDYSELDSENINKIPYLNAVIEETLRMYTPAATLVEREALVGHYIGQYYVPKSQMITVNLQPNHHDPTIYSEPMKFIPERWLSMKPQEPYQFVPFSAGSRNCIGQHLSMIELKCMLIYLLLNYYIEPQPGLQAIWTFKFVYTIQQNQTIQVRKI